ncbi:MAG: GNAT family N-acetyltransferase [Mitsuaria chitosanitabida]|jgi:ribosomal-protein-alanine N-acetyltransferase|uniref:GNAT family N-acetyltransferase n=1 Tax=Roseateles chitosanitabidus TaxID=65048 RepID=UPI001AFEA2C0|nr:GNAT family protein [Roseateles chitosanitabidus]MBO9685918.1 GNAT family N-acetyltransferase [Roseateles chitosanitabidus]
MLSLHPVSDHDLADLRRFEFDNRAFFESRINGRPGAFYEDGGVEAAIAAAQREAAADTGYQFLMRDVAGTLVGRINLIQVKRKHYHSCELGYRIAEAENGKGYAQTAVRLMLDKAFNELGLLRIEAKAHAGNPGSIRVLELSGFQQFGRSTRSIEIQGQWLDMLHFECHAPGRRT